LAQQQTDKSRGSERATEKNNDEENVSEQEIWSTIRYLDPDTQAKGSNIAVIVTLIAIFSICRACIVLHLCEL
jgi:hypothetical protein